VSVKLRFKRYGRTHEPVYRLAAMDSRRPRDGRTIEELGVYEPMHKDLEQQIRFNFERIDYWLSVGAQPTETVAAVLKKRARTQAQAAAPAASPKRR
jgi:small subunit ribosomal protein S16